MKRLILIATVFLYSFANAQSTSPYEWKWVRDGIWTGAAFGTSAYGLILIQNKDDISEVAVNNLDSDDINFIDRWAAGNSSESANNISDIPFAASFALPLGLLFDDEINDHSGQYIGMYLQSLSTTSAIYTITAGLVNRSRPYVYDENVNMDRRTSNNGQRSFYSGHVAAAATATFFAAKVYCDFNPDATGKGFIWAGAAAVPVAISYFRLQAGQHFLTDIVLGYALGAATGILIPEMHKIKNNSFDVQPVGGRNFRGENYTGLAFRYTF
ncbi:MAG TPA: phosphatase PAP2 family protein [Aquaticitalea sp.]|nr:phosphatase PAP2 family protein [Aquaticitalea sp.]